MELDVRMDKESLSITIENPFRLDLNSLVGEIERASPGARPAVHPTPKALFKRGIGISNSNISKEGSFPRQRSSGRGRYFRSNCFRIFKNNLFSPSALRREIYKDNIAAFHDQHLKFA
jgi:hypothetical protein